MSKTIEQLAILAAQIEEATRQGENTALRVGGLFTDIVEYIATLHLNDITLGPLLTSLNNSGLLEPSDGQTLAFSIMDDKWKYSDAITQIKLSIRGIEQTVASNYRAFLQVKDELEAQVNATDQRVREYKTEYDQSQIEYATWKSQTDTSISQYATAINKMTGDIVSISGRVDTAYDQLDFVTNDLEAADKAIGKIFDLAGMDLSDEPSASWLYKNKDGIYGAAATFDAEGNIKDMSTLSVTVNGISSKAENALGQVTLVSQSVGLLQAEVTRNKEISDAGFTQLSKLINDGDESLEHALQEEVNARTAEGQTTATRLTAVEGGISVINARFDEEGHPIGWSELKATVDQISSTVASEGADIKTLQNAINGTASNPGILSRLTANERSISSYADSISYIQQNRDSITATVGYFDSNGKLISTAGLVTEGNYAGLFAQSMRDNHVITQADLAVYVTEDELGNAISHIDLRADQIHLEGYTTVNNGFSVDQYGNVTMNDCTVNGTFHGKIDQTTSLGNSSGTYYRLELYTDERVPGTSTPILHSGIRGLNGNNTYFDLTFTGVGTGTEVRPLMTMSQGTFSKLYSRWHPDQFYFTDPRTGTTFSFGVDANGKISIFGTRSAWPYGRDAVSVGEVFVGDDECLRIKMT